MTYKEEAAITWAMRYLAAVLRDGESRPGAWGPDVTCVAQIRVAQALLEGCLAAHHARQAERPWHDDLQETGGTR